MYVETPPPPPPAAERGVHLHDGFYMRLSLGANGLRSTIESDRTSTEDAKVSGGGLSFDFMLGGTPTPGLVIGGALMVDTAPNPTVKFGDLESDGDFDASFGFIGPFIDGFFDPEGGFHVGGGIGFTGFTLDDKDSDEDDDLAFGGGGLSLWLGYDAWVSSQWSLGGLVRVSGGSGQRDIERGGVDSTEKATTGTFALLFTALMH
jgi:hypothetical protein